MAPVLPPRIAAAIGEATARLRARFGDRLQRVFLFGSFAWGEPDQDSDVDLCVVVIGLTRVERTAAIEIVAEVAIERDIPLSPLVWSAEELEFRLEREQALAEDISRRGVRL